MPTRATVNYAADTLLIRCNNKVPTDWPYRDKFNNALLELQEQGVLARLKNKWWNEVGAGVCSVSILFSNKNPS